MPLLPLNMGCLHQPSALVLCLVRVVGRQQRHCGDWKIHDPPDFVSEMPDWVTRRIVHRDAPHLRTNSANERNGQRISERQQKY